MDEAALLEDWRDWSRDAASVLARRYCWNDPATDAEDCMQEIAMALIQVARAGSEILLLDRREAQAYIYRCAVHGIYALQRREARRGAELDHGGHRDAIHGAAALDGPTCEGGTLADMLIASDADIEMAEARIDRALLSRAQRNAVDQLPEELREVMRLRLEGLVNADIARLLGMDVSAASRRVRQGCKRLRKSAALRAFVDWDAGRRRRRV